MTTKQEERIKVLERISSQKDKEMFVTVNKQSDEALYNMRNELSMAGNPSGKPLNNRADLNPLDHPRIGGKPKKEIYDYWRTDVRE